MKYTETKKYVKSSNQKSSENKLVEKANGNYKSRYVSGLSPKKEIVEENYKPTYKSRYK